ncbi:Cdc6/Cdc18 family protein [Candidatus Nitrosotenuis aquarius]|uniref:Cdc6/Cdc18 family protein n=1 Tax=Candidatus Nitrosotenuis aquarius TaxID=1846278 RepID=UPI000C1EB138|nr:ATP-binding protein [Candidatus Nitrosotenuis aquarius]
MKKSDIDAIVDKIDKENSIFKNKAALDVLRTPKRVIGRNKEVESLIRFFVSYKQGTIPPFVSVYGRSGSGKSTLVRFVCESLDDIALCFVNLRSAKTLFECANLILSELGAEALPSAKGLGAVVLAIKDAIASYLQDAKKHVIILALDEFDMIFYDKRNKPSDFMYKLVVLCEQLKKEKNYQLCIVGISNNVVSEYDLDERVRSRIGNSEVYFPAYGYEEILEILRMCSKEAFNEMDDVILQHCAKLSSQDHGDARRAIDLLRVGAEIAGAKNQALSTKHVDQAYAKLQNDRISEIMSRTTSQFKYVCRAIVYLSYIMGLEMAHTSKIYDEYKLIAPKESQLTYRRISEILNDIENTGIVTSQVHSRGRHGYGKQYKLEFSPNFIGPAINSVWWDNLVKMKKQMEESKQYDKEKKLSQSI